MKRLLIFSPFYPPHLGGLESYVSELSEELVQRKYKVTIFTSNVAPNIPHSVSSSPNLTIIRFPAIELVTNYPLPRLWTVSFWRMLKQALQPRPDFILSNTRFFSTSVLAMIVAQYFSIPWIHIEHGSWFVTVTSSVTTKLARWYDLTFGRLIFRSATATIAISKAVQRFVQRFDTRPTVLMYRGLDTVLIDKITPQRPVNISNDAFLILSVGRLFKWKGFEYSIKAINSLPDDIRQKVVLVIAGDGEDRKHLEKYASPHIIFLGRVSYDKTIALMKAADIYIHSSLQGGGLSTALLETLYCGCPIIATPHEGADEVVTDEENGLIIPEADISALQTALMNLIKNPDLRKKLGQAGLQYIKPLVSWQNSLDILADLFKKLARP